MTKPNIIVIMTDQQQARACRREGFPLDVTPHQDKMASDGVWFDKAYTSAPLCGPARVSLFTGRYGTCTGARCNNVGQFEARAASNMVEVVKGQGYKTAMVGKNHSHLTADDYDFWYEHGHQGAYDDKALAAEDRTAQDVEFDAWLKSLRHGVCAEPTKFPLECQSPYRLVSTAGKWITENKDQPFFMWLSIAEPHNPYQVPEPYFSMFRDQELPPIRGDENTVNDKGFKWQCVSQLQRKAAKDFDQKFDDYRYNYFGMVRLIDDQIKRLDGMLADSGVADNTVVIYISDHGDFVGDYGIMRKGPGLPESLCRIPFIVRGPGVVPGDGANDAHVNMVDIMPTVCQITGADIPLGVQGKSLLPVLQGNSPAEGQFDTAFCETGYGGLNYNWDDDVNFEMYMPESITFNELNQYALGGSMRMIRHKDWKLVADAEDNFELYDLKNDPAELTNLFDSNDPTALKMQSTLQRKMISKLIEFEEPLNNVNQLEGPDKVKERY